MKKVVFFTVMLLSYVIGYSQTENNATAEKLRFGFNLGLNYSNLLSKKPLRDCEKISNGFGAAIGIFMDYSITKNLSFSPKAELSLNNSKVLTSNIDKSVTTYEVLPVSLNFMTHLIIKKGKGKFKPYFLIGPNFKLPVSKKPSLSTDFATEPDFAIDFGIGFEKAFTTFIIAPELRYSFGLLNINENPAIETLNFHNISLIFNFK